MAGHLAGVTKDRKLVQAMENQFRGLKVAKLL